MPGWWCEIAITGDSSVTLETRAGNYSASMGRCVIRALGEMFICWSLGTWINEPIVSAPACSVQCRSVISNVHPDTT